MEKEQIVKALKWCSELRLCVDCPMRTEGYFTHSGNACRQALMQNALSLIREQEKRIEKIKADTVRKMQVAIKERCIKGGIYPAFVKNVVKAVAKELLEDFTPPKKLLSLEDVSRAIKDYCCDLIDAGKDMVEVTEFNADLQKVLSREIFRKETE